MKIQFCSDLHLEFPENKKYLINNPIVPTGEVMLHGGDIMLFRQLEQHNDFLNYLSDHFRMTYWIPGNHEYYHSSIDKRTGSFSENLRKNVVLINNRSVVESGVELVLTTLWSKISPTYGWNIQMNMSDFHVIKKEGKTISVTDYNNLHDENIQFLTKTLSKKASLPRIVLTHHAPTFMNYPEQYRNDPLNEAFATELFDLISSTQPNHWIFGHHHRNVKPFYIGNCLLQTNQLGYVSRGEAVGFRGDMVVEV